MEKTVEIMSPVQLLHHTPHTTGVRVQTEN